MERALPSQCAEKAQEKSRRIQTAKVTTNPHILAYVNDTGSEGRTKRKIGVSTLCLTALTNSQLIL